MKYILFILTMLASNITHPLFAQNDIRLGFVLQIDGECVITSNISNEMFVLKTEAFTDSIPFRYEVGSIFLSTSAFDSLQKYNDSKDTIFISFRYARPLHEEIIFEQYVHKIPHEFINPVYLIMNVYTYRSSESRKKYAMKKGRYGIELSAPGWDQTFPRRKQDVVDRL